MGLDIYLYKCPDLEYADKMDAAYQEGLDATYDWWRELDTIGEATADEEAKLNQKRAALKMKYEIEGYDHKSRVEVYMESTTQKDHLFKIGYLRSSYNDAGFNSVMTVFGLATLYDIFDFPREEVLHFKPDWEKSLERVKDAIEKYDAHLKSPMGKYHVTTFRPHLNYGVDSDKEALEKFNQEILQRKSDTDFFSGGFTNRDGMFLTQPLKVVAIINHALKQEKDLKDSKNLWERWSNMPHMYLVHETEGGDESQKWYMTALKIVQENIEYVLAQKDKDDHYLVWSA